MGEVPKKRIYLEAYIGHLALVKACHHLLYKVSGEVISDLSTNKIFTINSKVYSQA